MINPFFNDIHNAKVLREIIHEFDLDEKFRQGHSTFRLAVMDDRLYGGWTERREYGDHTIGWYEPTPENRQRLLANIKAEFKYRASLD